MTPPTAGAVRSLSVVLSFDTIDNTISLPSGPTGLACRLNNPQLVVGTGSLSTAWHSIRQGDMGMFLYASNSKRLLKFSIDYPVGDYDLAGNLSFYNSPGRGAVFECKRIEGEDVWVLLQSGGQFTYHLSSDHTAIADFGAIRFEYAPTRGFYSLLFPKPVLCGCDPPMPGSSPGSAIGRITTEGWGGILEPVNGSFRELVLVESGSLFDISTYRYVSQAEEGEIVDRFGENWKYLLYIECVVYAKADHHSIVETLIFYRLRHEIFFDAWYSIRFRSACYPYRRIMMDAFADSNNPSWPWRKSTDAYEIGTVSSII